MRISVWKVGSPPVIYQQYQLIARCGLLAQRVALSCRAKLELTIGLGMFS